MLINYFILSLCSIILVDSQSVSNSTNYTLLNTTKILQNFQIPPYNKRVTYPFNTSIKINIGFLIPKDDDEFEDTVGYHKTASAVMIGLNELIRAGFIDTKKILFEFYFRFSNCSVLQGTKTTIELLQDDDVDVFFGVSCDELSDFVSVIATAYNTPVYLWGPTISAYISKTDYIKSVVSTSISTSDYSNSLKSLVEYFNWTKVAFVYMTNDTHSVCGSVQQDFVNSILITTKTVVVHSGEVNITRDSMTFNLAAIAKVARIVITCIPDNFVKRKFMLTAREMEMTNEEYVYIIVDVNDTVLENKNDFIPLWKDASGVYDGKDEEALEAFKYALLFDKTIENNVNMKKFATDISHGMLNYPFNCNDTKCISNANDPNFRYSTYAPYLADTMILYGLALNRTLSTTPLLYNDAKTLKNNSVYPFEGFTGTIVLDSGAVRCGYFYLRVVGNDSTLHTVMTISEFNNLTYTVNLGISNESEIWWNRKNNARPLDTPICGFLTDNCPKTFWEEYFIIIIVGSISIVCIVIALIIVIILLRRSRLRQQQQLDMLWLIEYRELKSIDIKDRMFNKSYASLNGSQKSLKGALEMINNEGIEIRNGLNIQDVEGKKYIVYQYNDEIVVGEKFKGHIDITTQERQYLRMLRNIDHECLNKFLGLTESPSNTICVWKFCVRGNLKDLLRSKLSEADPYFVVALMNDIVSGIQYLHFSKINCHGRLTSSCCLLDNHYQVKLTKFGLPFIRKQERKNEEEKLYTSPELLRSHDVLGSKEGDIYSFGIISAELLNKSLEWPEEESRNYSNSEIISRVRNSMNGSFRPIIRYDTRERWVKDVITLIKECWDEDPHRRRKIDMVKKMIKNSMNNKKINMMDYMFKKMENYASHLESEVMERTKELVDEKKKSDILLYRMIPKSIADEIKAGRSVEPEYFATATVFFSDVVNFTVLCSQCTPLQVVSFLNQLYSQFDSIIEKYDAYKVETIGDAYLVVSGIPIRNDNRHGEMIANMALGFMKALPMFKLSFLPDYKLNIRIGLHTGSVVAGVVGQQMPRYCLFGDTVNTASRMESNGMPGCIHITSDMYELLSLLGGFDMDCRGEVMIKGKGLMTTYWLLGLTDDEFTLKMENNN
uniref:Guanylate cyclase n=1 Tax=Parastrongyloides trichosuri TaxID=131310 RepID=A0A0N4Z5T7_PARTI